MEELDSIAVKYGTDKSSLKHAYTKLYQEYLSKYKNESMNILEIGVFNGSSVKMWEEYFKLSRIYGIDINEECLKYNSDRIKILIGDQSDEAFINDILLREIQSEIDLIIDDGSHMVEHINDSFLYLFPHLKKGGLYIIEDTHCSYHNNQRVDFNNFINNILLSNLDTNGKTTLADLSKYNNSSFNYLEKSLEYVHFYKSIIFIKKR